LNKTKPYSQDDFIDAMAVAVNNFSFTVEQAVEGMKKVFESSAFDELRVEVKRERLKYDIEKFKKEVSY